MRLPPLAGCTISTDAIPASYAIISKLTCEASRLIRACVPRIRSFASPRPLILGLIPASPTALSPARARTRHRDPAPPPPGLFYPSKLGAHLQSPGFRGG